MERGQQIYHVQHTSFLLLSIASNLDQQLDTGIPYPSDHIVLPFHLQHPPQPILLDHGWLAVLWKSVMSEIFFENIKIKNNIVYFA